MRRAAAPAPQGPGETAEIPCHLASARRPRSGPSIFAALFRDALLLSMGAHVTAMHPDKTDSIVTGMADMRAPSSSCAASMPSWSAARPLDQNVKPKFALDAMVAKVNLEMRRL